MRIELSLPQPTEVSTNRASNSPVSSQSASAASPTDNFSGDTVSLSSLSAQALQLPDVRQDKIDTLRQQIASGQYQVDPQKIADAILSH
jgi:negative regulator of flagellin synthesis FlgM